MTTHHIAVPSTKIRLSWKWEALCGATDAELYTLYPQYATVKYKKFICQECLDTPDYSLLLLSGYYDI
jgi:hypothetical protein